MTTYLVTLELKTPWWWRVLRFFRLKSKRKEFEIAFKKDWRCFLPIIGIYFCLNYYFKKSNKTTMDFFSSEEMIVYHFTMATIIIVFQFI